jgi:hypothetical protein
LVRIDFLEELVLLEDFAGSLEALPHEHERDNPAKDYYPNDPGAWGDPEFAAFAGISVVVVVISIVVSHFAIQLAQNTINTPLPQCGNSRLPMPMQAPF